MLHPVTLLLVATCSACATSAPVHAVPGCRFECVYWWQPGEYQADTSSSAFCCWVDPDGYLVFDTGECKGNHSPVRTCYESGWLWNDGDGCVCTPDEGEVEKCVEANVTRTVTYFMCGTDGGVPVCRPYAFGMTMTLSSQVPAPCLP